MHKTSVFAKFLSLVFVLSAIAAIGLTDASAQSQAINGQIEGVVSDSNGAAIPSASVKVVNIETGAERTVTTDNDGVYRVPLLPLGTYRVTVEAANFKRLVREGITLTTGQTATVNTSLEAGAVSETVTVTSDAPIADPGKIDLGRVMNTREVQNLPNVSRNPYNFALLQSNVTGRPNAEFGVPRINANGYTRRTNYQLDGNSNTQADRGGIRLIPISDTFISEVQLVTNGFAAEFGNTPGLIMNAVTPSGTNQLGGSVGYRFRRSPFYARPFFYNSPFDIPKTTADDLTVAVGGPIVKDRWHFYTGYEYIKRDLTSESGRLVTISPTNQALLVAEGVSAAAFVPVIPTSQKVNFFIVRTDAQLNESNRLTARFNYFDNKSPNNIGGGLNTLERSIDFIDKSYSLGLQLASSITTNVFNEFRYQYATRDSRNEANASSGTGVSIVISGVANFGAPEISPLAPLETINQFQNNLTWSTGNHAFKFGGGLSRIDDARESAVFARYTFASIAQYRNARTGVSPRTYTNFTQAFGDPRIEYQSTYYNWFVQDDWKVTQRLKLNLGLRYDLYDVPDANENAPFFASREFNVDKNNFAPRLGFVYALREGNRPTVIRASTGIYYEPPYLDIYLRALQNGGDTSRYYTVSFNPANNLSAPSFPNVLPSAAGGTTIDTITPDYENMYAIHANAQIEQALTNNLSFTAGYIHSSGRKIPVYRDINLINPIRILADGRGVYSNAVSAATRLNPSFNHIYMVEAAGNSKYDALTFQLNKRFSQGYQFSLNYTLSKATDDAPEQNLVATQVGNLVLSDPYNRVLDKGPSLADQRHTFVGSFVVRPIFSFENKVLNYILNDNQLGVIAVANSGERFNIVSTADINGDGLTNSDRPVGIGRNSGKTPKQINVDLRYSRFFSFTERFKLEAFGEFINVFNVRSIFQINNPTVTTESITGLPTQDLPTISNRAVTALDSRQFQLGFKFIF